MNLEIVKFDHFGRGIAYNDEKVVFVNKALPGEIVEVEIIQNKKNYQVAKVLRVIKASPDRTFVACPFYDQCGGCSLLHMTYEKEKAFKTEKAKEILGVSPTFYETKTMNYRNKVTLHVIDGKIGLYEEKSHHLIGVDNCLLLDKKINQVLRDLRKIVNTSYHMNSIIIKCIQEKLLLDIDKEVDSAFVDYFDYIDTITYKNKVLKGQGYLEEVIGNKIFKVTSKAFFQVNKEGLESIYQIIQKYLIGKKVNIALDLYSGTSLWGILISDYVKKITCIESNEEACENALFNVQRNNIHNIEIIKGKVEDYIDTFANIDLVIVDPPRSGLDKKTRNYLKRISSRYLIYISCDMITLKRDLEELREVYDIKELNLVDMFKRTYHVESAMLFQRK